MEDILWYFLPVLAVILLNGIVFFRARKDQTEYRELVSRNLDELRTFQARAEELRHNNQAVQSRRSALLDVKDTKIKLEPKKTEEKTESKEEILVI